MIYIVWEKMIGIPGENFTQKKFDRRVFYYRHKAALDLYETNSLAVQAIWDLWTDTEHRAVIVSYLPPILRGALNARLEHEGIPHLRTIFSTAVDMARTVGIHKEITRIVDANPLHRLTYGPKGLCLPAHAAHIIGKAA